MSTLRAVRIRRHRDQRAAERELLERAITAPPELRLAWWRLYTLARSQRDRPAPLNKAAQS